MTPELARLVRALAFAGAVGGSLIAWNPAAAQLPPLSSGDPVEELLERRRELDRTVWAPEIEAQRYETRFVNLWDELLQAGDGFAVLASFPFKTMSVGRVESADSLALGIQRTRFGAPVRELLPADWRALLGRFKRDGYEIAHTEWHHSAFEPARAGRAARSEVSGVIHAARPDPPHRVTLRFMLDIVWSDQVRLPFDSAQGTPSESRGVKPDGHENAVPDEVPVPESIAVAEIEILERHAEPALREMLTIEGTPGRPRIHPLLVYDLDADGLPEIVLGGRNTIIWNRGGGRFEAGPFLPEEQRLAGAGILADFNNDGHVDFVGVDTSRHALLFAGGPDGRFTTPGRRIGDMQFEQPRAFTAGDIDNDGSLDLFIANYKLAYEGGQMPSPYFDANDGYPAYLLRNNGDGTFSDITEQSGLAPKRFRRTYSASFVDLDEDGDLDLIVVSDYAGLDVYLNDGDGDGRFTDVTGRFDRERHLFGMSHTFADFDGDGLLDFYVIGMHSTTAQRLERMGLGPPGMPEHTALRSVMAYGNRMFLREGDLFRQAPFNDQVARTGWSWGAASFDVDNDGHPDIFVGNGHVSGQSTRDYCSEFWRHDIYTCDSKRDAVRETLFQYVMRPLQNGAISWNGYEHNVLLMNHGGAAFTDVGFLLGEGWDYDGRAVVAADLDADGLVDLLATELKLGGASGPDRYVLHLYQNRLAEAGNWIGIRLHDSHGLSPVGATVTVFTAARRHIARVVTGDSFAAQHPATVHFGLGAETEIDAVEVRWVTGARRRIERPAINQYLTVRPE